MGERSPFPAVAGPIKESPPGTGDLEGVLFVFDPQTTPKARLVGPASAVEQAVMILQPLLGRALPLQDGVGWNLSRRSFEAAEAWWIAHGEPAPARSQARRLVALDEAPPPTLGRSARRLNFTGFGRTFRLTARQAQAAGGSWSQGCEVRYAYYGRPESS